MFSDTIFYVFKTECKGKEATENNAQQIRDFLEDNENRGRGVSYGLYQLDADNDKKTLTLAAFPWKQDNFEEDRLLEELKDYKFNVDEIEKMDAQKLEKKYPKAAETIRSLFRRRSLCSDDWKIVLSTDSEEEVMKKIKASHNAEFVQTMENISRSIEQNKTTKANCGIVFVCDKRRSAEKYIKLFCNYCFAKGLVSDYHYIIGELSDALSTRRNTSFFYEIADDYDDGENGRFRFHAASPEYMYKLCGRKPIYISCVNEKTFEKLSNTVDSFKSIFPFEVKLGKQTMEEKIEMLEEEARGYGFGISEEFRESKMLEEDLQKILDKLAGVTVAKLAKMPCDYILTPKDFEEQKRSKKCKKAVTAVQELESLIGLENVKSTVREIAAVVKKIGADSDCGFHMVFRGNPGTGKTTVARIIGRILGEIGVLKRPERFVEGDRETLVAAYVGHTALKTKHYIEKAKGGVLFIDEAYALCTGKRDKSDFGYEAIATLIKAMEDQRNEFVCILAGYTREMDEMLNMNPGIRSRITFYIDFPDYSAREMLQILERTCEKEKYTLNDEAKECAMKFFEAEAAGKDPNFANGRTVRSLFEMARMKQALRSSSKKDREFTGEDFANAAVALGFSKDMSQKKSFGFVA